ncbi:hypothetical protein D9M68_727750 [compost metagenome]
MLAHAVADAEELDAVACLLQERRGFLEFFEHLHALAQRRVGKLKGLAAQCHTLAREVVRDPVVRQPRSGEHEVTGLEASDVVADEGPAPGVRDQVQFIFVVAMPAFQRRRTAVLEAVQKTALARRCGTGLRGALEAVLDFRRGVASRAGRCRGSHRGRGVTVRGAIVVSAPGIGRSSFACLVSGGRTSGITRASG